MNRPIIALPSQTSILIEDIDFNTGSFGTAVSGFSTVTIDNSLLESNDISIFTTTGNDTINLLEGAQVRGVIDGGAGSDVLNIALTSIPDINSDSLFLSENQLLNVETIYVANNFTITNAFLNNSPSSNLRIANGINLSVSDTGEVNSMIQFLGNNHFSNFGAVTTSNLVFSDTTYQITADTQSITATNLNLGGLTVQLSTNYLAVNNEQVLFTGVNNLTGNVSSVNIVDSFGSVLPSSSYFLFERDDEIILTNSPAPSVVSLVNPQVSIGQNIVNLNILAPISHSIDNLFSINYDNIQINVTDTAGDTVTYDPSDIVRNGNILTVRVANFNDGDTLTVDYDYRDPANRVLSGISYVVEIVENIRARILGDIIGEVVEDNTLEAQGTLQSQDIDNTNNSFFTSSGTSALGYGSYSITEEGQWTYSLDNSLLIVQRLNSIFDTLTDTFIVSSIDGTSQLITITIRGDQDIGNYIFENNHLTVLSNIDASANSFLPGGSFVGTHVSNLPIPSNIDSITLNNAVEVNADIIGFNTVTLNVSSSAEDIVGTASEDTFIFFDNSSFTSLDGGNGEDTVSLVNSQAKSLSLFSNIERIEKAGVGDLDVTSDNSALNDLEIIEGNLNLSSLTGTLSTNLTLNSGSTLSLNLGTPGSLGATGNIQNASTGVVLANGGHLLRIMNNVDIQIANSSTLDSSAYIDGETFFIIAEGGNYNIDSLDTVRIFDGNLSGGFFRLSLVEDNLILVWHTNEIRQIVEDTRPNYSASASQSISIVADLIDSGVLSSTNSFLNNFVANYNEGSVNERKEIVESLVPTSYTSIAPAIQNVVKDISLGLKNRAFAKSGIGLVNVQGPNSLDLDLSLNGHFWYDFSYGSGSRDSVAEISGYDYDGYTVRLGYDRLYGEAFLGGSLSYGVSTIDNTGTIDSTDIGTFSLGFYGKLQQGSTFINANLLVAFSAVDSTRDRLDEQLSGDTTSLGVDLDFNYAYVNKVDNSFKLAYLLGLRYNITQLDNLLEEGVESRSDLLTNTLSETYNSLYLKLGSIVTWSLFSARKQHYFSILTNWSYNVLDTDRDLTTQFTNGGDKFDVDGIDEERSSIAFGFTWQIKSKKSLVELGYTYRFTSISNSNILTAKITYNF